MYSPWEEEEEYARQVYEEKLFEEWVQDQGLVHPNDAISDFTSERLRSYYLNHPDLTQPAATSLAYARSLLGTYSRAAIVFAVGAMEMAWKNVLVRPLVFGLVHTEEMAAIVSTVALKRNSLEDVKHLLPSLLAKYGGVDLKQPHHLTQSTRSLWQEMLDIQGVRNSIAHSGDAQHDSKGPLAVAIAEALLEDIFPSVIGHLNLTLCNGKVVGRLPF